MCLILEPYKHFFALSAHSSIIMLNIDFIFILILFVLLYIVLRFIVGPAATVGLKWLEYT